LGGPLGRFPKSKEITVRIEGRLHLLAMRYSKDEWILMPCELAFHIKNRKTTPLLNDRKKRRAARRAAKGKTTSQKAALTTMEIHYQKDSILIKKLDDLGPMKTHGNIMKLKPKSGF